MMMRGMEKNKAVSGKECLERGHDSLNRVTERSGTRRRLWWCGYLGEYILGKGTSQCRGTTPGMGKSG